MDATGTLARTGPRLGDRRHRQARPRPRPLSLPEWEGLVRLLCRSPGRLAVPLSPWPRQPEDACSRGRPLPLFGAIPVPHDSGEIRRDQSGCTRIVERRPPSEDGPIESLAGVTSLARSAIKPRGGSVRPLQRRKIPTSDGPGGVQAWHAPRWRKEVQRSQPHIQRSREFGIPGPDRSRGLWASGGTTPASVLPSGSTTNSALPTRTRTAPDRTDGVAPYACPYPHVAPPGA
jgi:hypothetical protein